MDTQIITENGAKQQEKTEENKIIFEQKLWAETKKSRSPKIAGALLMVLSDDGETSTIGVPASLRYDVCGGGNYSLQIELEELVKKLSGRRWVKFEEADQLCQERAKFLAKLEIEQAKELEIKNVVQAQKNAGRCNIVPFPKEVAKEIITADASIAGLLLFAGNTFKGNCRIVERTITDHQTCEKTRLRIKIGSKTNKCGVLKQSHHRALHIAWQQWAKREHKLAQEEGLHKGVVEISMYKWTKLLCGSTGGSNYIYAMSVLEQMAAIRIEIAEASESGVVKTCGFSLISFSWTDKSMGDNGQWTTPGKNTRVRILMSEYITNNFLRKRLRPMSLKTYLEIKDPGRKGIAPLLFDWLEYQLASRELYSKKLSKFPEDFGTTAYKHKSLRKQTLTPVIAQLNGLLILEGQYTLKVWLEETADGSDYKLIAQRISVAH